MPAETHSSKSPKGTAQSNGPASVISGPADTDDSSVAMEVDYRTNPKSDDDDDDEDPPTFGKFPRSHVVVSTEVAAKSNTNTRRGRYECRHQQSHRVAKLNTRQVTLDNLPYLTAKLEKLLEDNPSPHGSGSGLNSKGASNHLEKSHHLLDSSGGPEGPNGVDRYIEAFNEAKAMKEEGDVIMKRGHCACVKCDGEGKEDSVPRCHDSSPPINKTKKGQDSKSF